MNLMNLAQDVVLGREASLKSPAGTAEKVNRDMILNLGYNLQSFLWDSCLSNLQS